MKSYKKPKQKKQKLKRFKEKKPLVKSYVEPRKNNPCPCLSGKKYKKCCGEYFK